MMKEVVFHPRGIPVPAWTAKFEPDEIIARQRVQDWQGVWIWRHTTEEVLMSFFVAGIKAQVEAETKIWAPLKKAVVDAAVKSIDGKFATMKVGF